MGNRGFTSSALARVASFRDRLANPVFHVNLRRPLHHSTP